MLLKEEYDDRTDQLAKSSFMRLPVKEMKKWAHLAPTDWRDLFRNLPLKHFGAQNSIGSKTIEIMHNKKVSFILLVRSFSICSPLNGHYVSMCRAKRCG